MMKTLLIILVVLAAGVIGVGFYRGWFEVSSDKDDPNKNVKLSYDEEKFKDDTAKAQQKLQQSTSKKEPARQP